MKIYSVSTRHYYAFGGLVSEEVSYKIKCACPLKFSNFLVTANVFYGCSHKVYFPSRTSKGVRWVYPDSYLDVKNKETLSSMGKQFHMIRTYLQSGKQQNSCRIAGFCASCAIQKHVSRALQSTGRILAPNDDLASNLRCISPNDDPLLDLSLEIAKADSLLKALKNFTAAELLDGGEKQYQCQRCKQKVRAMKQITVYITKAPHSKEKVKLRSLISNKQKI
ncbi:hypothetical protein QQP08_020672 [Theobroma cacao]|nr:hypothetical protein QQP08_020672 [Theobroma cacao]